MLIGNRVWDFVGGPKSRPPRDWSPIGETMERRLEQVGFIGYLKRPAELLSNPDDLAFGLLPWKLTVEG
jgi:hypothetical protein